VFTLKILAEDSMNPNKSETSWKSACWLRWENTWIFHRKL